MTTLMTVLAILVVAYLVGVAAFTLMYSSWGAPPGPSLRTALRWPDDVIERWYQRRQRRDDK